MNDEAVYRTAPATPGLLNTAHWLVMSSCIADGRESIGKLAGAVQLRWQTWRSSLRVKIGQPTPVLFGATH